MGPGLTGSGLTEARAAEFARIALGHVMRDYPYKPDLVLSGPGDLRPPREWHPIFHGSYDWHSCVHTHWMLARLLRRFPDAAFAAPVRALFDAGLTAEKVAGERAFLARPDSRGFERPYGWGWLLALAAELDDTAWGPVLAPLARDFAARFHAFLPRAAFPVRTGTHTSTAFALAMAAPWAARHDPALLALFGEAARRWYAGDADCPCWEPGGDDFLSPALVEAECLRRLWPAKEFRPWFDRFLPRLERGEPATLFHPVPVNDRTDGKIAHLDGLNLSRAWCWRSLAPLWPPGDTRRVRAETAAGAHLAASLPHLSDHYMGEHWLASFALLALEA